MAWQILIGYIVFSQIVLGCWLRFSQFSDDDDESEDVLENASGKARTLVYVIAAVLVFFTAPVVLPVMLFLLFKCCRQARAEGMKLFRMHKNLILDPLHYCNIPQELEAYMEEHTRAPVTLGYEQLGDFWMREEPFNSKARIFLSLPLAEHALKVEKVFLTTPSPSAWNAKLAGTSSMSM